MADEEIEQRRDEPAEIVATLRWADVLVLQGRFVAEAVRSTRVRHEPPTVEGHAEPNHLLSSAQGIRRAESRPSEAPLEIEKNNKRFAISRSRRLSFGVRVPFAMALL